MEGEEVSDARGDAEERRAGCKVGFGERCTCCKIGFGERYTGCKVGFGKRVIGENEADKGGERMEGCRRR